MADGHVTVRTGSRVTGRLIFGLAILGPPADVLLDNYGLADAGDLLRWWPFALIAAGLVNALGPDRRRVMGTILAGVGLWLLLHTLGYVPYGPFEIWPIFLVLLGLVLVSRSMRGAPTPGADLDGRAGQRLRDDVGHQPEHHHQELPGRRPHRRHGRPRHRLRKSEIADGSR